MAAVGLGKIMQVVSAGLVHSPNLLLTALSREETQMALTSEDMTKITQALGLSDDAGIDDVLSAITALATPDPAKYVPLEAVKDMIAEHTSTAMQREEGDIALKVSTAIERGYMPPSMREWAVALCRQDMASFDTFVANIAPQFAHVLQSNDHRFNGQPPGKATLHRTEGEKAVCDQLGIDPDMLVASNE